MAKLITRTFETNVYSVLGIDTSKGTPEIINTYISAETEKDARKSFETIYGTTPASVNFDHTEIEMYGITPELFKLYGTPLDPETRKPLEIPKYENLISQSISEMKEGATDEN